MTTKKLCFKPYFLLLKKEIENLLDIKIEYGRISTDLVSLRTSE